MASSDTWSVVFKGSGGHGAMPERASDPTFPAAQFITAVQGIIGRMIAATAAADGAHALPATKRTQGDAGLFVKHVALARRGELGQRANGTGG